MFETKRKRTEQGCTEKEFKVKCADGYKLNAVITCPENARKLVIYVNGSGPVTSRTLRKFSDGRIISYHKLFADEFAKRGIAYCSYSARGVTDGKKAPLFCDIDKKKYKTALPSNSVSDVECLINHLREKHGIDCPVYLLGWSEGTIISPLVAARGNVEISGLFLAGYCNENLKDILTWQLRSGESAMLNMRKMFDYDKKGYITKQDYEEDRKNVREKALGNAEFSALDKNGDGILTAEDFISEDYLNSIFDAIGRNDDEWLENNYPLPLTSGWFKEHFSLTPNRETLPKLDIPVHIFHGEFDANIPVSQMWDIEKTFKEKGKNNLTVHYFDEHDHNLNYGRYMQKGELSEGLQELFDTAEKI